MLSTLPDGLGGFRVGGLGARAANSETFSLVVPMLLNPAH